MQLPVETFKLKVFDNPGPLCLETTETSFLQMFLRKRKLVNHRHHEKVWTEGESESDLLQLLLQQQSSNQWTHKILIQNVHLTEINHCRSHGNTLGPPSTCPTLATAHQVFLYHESRSHQFRTVQVWIWGETQTWSVSQICEIQISAHLREKYFTLIYKNHLIISWTQHIVESVVLSVWGSSSRFRRDVSALNFWRVSFQMFEAQKGEIIQNFTKNNQRGEKSENMFVNQNLVFSSFLSHLRFLWRHFGRNKTFSCRDVFPHRGETLVFVMKQFCLMLMWFVSTWLNSLIVSCFG